MKDVCSKERCTGCSACINRCHTGAIRMQCDSDGFLFPHINESVCVDCGQCVAVCKSAHQYNGSPIISSYIAKSTNTETVINSSSGGVFYVLSKYVLDNNGVVIGVGYDEYGSIKHMDIEDVNSLHILQGSKYVQSDLGSIFKKVKVYLDDGRLVLFSGTPCQVSGLLAFLGRQYKDLITIDTICHGVPSPKIWNDYVKHISNGNLIKKINFRNKKYGWNDYSLKIELNNGKTYSERRSTGLYLRGFNSNISLRECCYSCEFKGEKRSSDITIADAWGIQSINPSMNYELGTSLVLIHSKIGETLFKNTSSCFDYKSVDYSDYARFNKSLYNSALYNKNRDEFFAFVSKRGVIRGLKKYCAPSISVRIKSILRDIRNMRRIIRNEKYHM